MDINKARLGAVYLRIQYLYCTVGVETVERAKLHSDTT